MEGLQNTFAILIAVSAALAAVAGLFVLGRFFKDKLKDLFNDTEYFVFFFLVWGYFLYSVGEVSFYLANVTLKTSSPLGIADVYWSIGAVFILIAFIALSKMLLSKDYNSGNLTLMFVIGAALMAFVIYLLFFGLKMGSEVHFFNYFYPIISALIVTFALSVLLYSSKLEGLSGSLIFFFLASCGILAADLLFSFTNTQKVYDSWSIATDFFYLFGYLLSFVGFVALRLNMQKK